MLQYPIATETVFSRNECTEELGDKVGIDNDKVRKLWIILKVDQNP
jgi:hypothetical protein